MTLHEAKIAQKYAKIAEQQKRYSQTVFRGKPFWIIDIKHAKLDYISIAPITKMTNQYKTQSHRKLTFIIIFEVYLRVVPVLAVKRFNFYYAKSLVGNTLYEQKEDEVKKIKHLLLGIDSYRKYLRNRLGLDIDSAKVYPKITALVSEDRNALIKSMYEAFSEDADKSKPITCLTTLLNIPAQEILVKEHTRDKIKQLSLLLIPVITVIISVFNLVLK